MHDSNVAHQAMLRFQSCEDNFSFQRCKEPGSVWPVMDHPKTGNSEYKGKEALNNELPGPLASFSD